MQSGKPVGVFQTHPGAPRVLIANALLVPAWATWENFRELEQRGLTMYGQMTAGSWIYIGSQGIVQGTYETLAAVGAGISAARSSGRLVVTAGLGGMGGAQPLAATMNGAAALVIEVDPQRIARRLATRYLDEATDSLDEALDRVGRWTRDARRRARSACARTPPTCCRRSSRAASTPDVLTDQTSAHDALNGYVPERHVARRGRRGCASATRRTTSRASMAAMAEHVRAMLDAASSAARSRSTTATTSARRRSRPASPNAFDIPGFVPEYIRPLFCEGKGPFRWAALSGDPEDIRVTDEAALEMFAHDEALVRWIHLARERVAFQGLPARICGSATANARASGCGINELVREGRIKAPIVIGRDHLDTGSVASPNRETEGMRDGSDAIADWPILNALLNASSGATWVSVHHGGGVGIGYSLHAGMVIVADGTRRRRRKARTRADLRSGHRRRAPRRRRLSRGDRHGRARRRANSDA